MTSTRKSGIPLLLVGSLILAACGSVPPERPAPLAAAEQDLRAGHEAADAGEYRRALEHYRTAMARYRSLDRPREQAYAMISAAELRLLLGETGPARVHVSAVREMDHSGGLSDLSTRLAWLDARIHASRGDREAALDTIAPLLESLPAQPELRRGVLITRAQIALDAGEDASPWLERIEMPDGEGIGAAIARGRLHRLQAGQALIDGDRAAARASLEAARQAYRASAHRPGLAATRESLAELAHEEGRVDEALQHLEAAVTMRLWMRDRVHARANVGRLVEWAEGSGDARQAPYRRALNALEQGEWPHWPPASTRVAP